MSDKLKIWDPSRSWEDSEKEWDLGKEKSAGKKTLKTLKKMPKMPGITKETKKNLSWKSFKYMLSHDEKGALRKSLAKHPFRYLYRYLCSLAKKKSFVRDGDFFLYGLETLSAFKQELEDENSLLVVGFSYCHKPHECPSGRFSTDCIHDPKNEVCRQCFIGKSVNALPEKRCIPLFITTVHYVSEKIFDTVHAYPDRNVLFLITACEMTLKMFGDWGNIAPIKGLGVRLDGRICNTMRAFELSEKGVKPGLTVVLDDTQKKILELIRLRRECEAETAN